MEFQGLPKTQPCTYTAFQKWSCLATLVIAAQVIHITGSNGKRKRLLLRFTIYYLGEKNAGLFTSPHLNRCAGAFQLNGDLCGEDPVFVCYAPGKRLQRNWNGRSGLSDIFRVYFCHGHGNFEEGPEWSISYWRQDFGGRLDATNSVAHPVLCIITSISLEHTEILGDTIAQLPGKSGNYQNRRTGCI